MKRLLVIAVCGYLVIAIGMRLVIYGPTFIQQSWWVFTEGGAFTPRQAVIYSFKEAWNSLGWRFYRQPILVPFNAIRESKSPQEWQIMRQRSWEYFVPLETRLDADDGSVVDRAIDQLRTLNEKRKEQIGFRTAQYLVTSDQSNFYKGIRILQVLAEAAHTAVPVLVQNFARFNVSQQWTIRNIFYTVGPRAKVALPLLYAELDTLKTFQPSPRSFGRCGTGPRPAYDDFQLYAMAFTIQTIRRIDPDQTPLLIQKLKELSLSGNSYIAVFCARETESLRRSR